MTYYEHFGHDGSPLERLDRNGLWVAGQGVVRLPTAEELAGMDAEDATAGARGADAATRTALTDALNLATLYPAPTPEENAIIDAQVATALAGFRDLSSPPADVVALAAAVVSWRATT